MEGRGAAGGGRRGGRRASGRVRGVSFVNITSLAGHYRKNEYFQVAFPQHVGAVLKDRQSASPPRTLRPFHLFVPEGLSGLSHFGPYVL